MPRKGMRSLCFTYRPSSGNSFANSRSHSFSFNEAMTEQSIEIAAALIMKWDIESSSYAKVTSLFYDNKREAMKYIRCVNNLQKAMDLLVSENSTSGKLVYAQKLMQIAMKRLQKEFYQILSMNRAHLDPESVSARSSLTSARSSFSDFFEIDDSIIEEGDRIAEVEEVSFIAVADLKSIAECMISSGYAKECMSIYKIIRKSIIDEGIYRVGVEKMGSSQMNKIHKMDWKVVENKIKKWLDAVGVAVKTLFNGERILCDSVFASTKAIKEACFSKISKEGALLLFRFPELILKNKKSHSLERMFRLLDMYAAIAGNWPAIESIFSFDSTIIIQTEALNSLNKLSESVRNIISDFETSIHKDSSKSQIPGGDVHPLTKHVMDYLTILADYSQSLNSIFADWSPPGKSPLSEFSFDNPNTDEPPPPAVSLRMAWLILMLLCKLDSKANHYKHVYLSYLFLANNVKHIMVRVRTSNLKYILGEQWIARHENKVKQFSSGYERLAWGKVLESLPKNPTAAIPADEASERLKKFKKIFQETYRKQSSCVMPDAELRDEIKVALERKILPAYQAFYDAHKDSVARERDGKCNIKITPEVVRNYLTASVRGSWRFRE